MLERRSKFHGILTLIHLCLATLGNSVDPDQTPQNEASDQSALFPLSTGISIKHGYNKKNQTPPFVLEMYQSKVLW